ncbi:DUF3180 domain-containing protein [uncultured Bifidobacterium sp.]|uniref:DUF3180 domain-containing protein n=1 Tax=uncultured Bifidobacterium sp. TaxID=165187 RepID=UPI0028DCF3B8|nr:DUF3180 domain-containing protein [uncultured Bifidobacterium sp.]
MKARRTPWWYYAVALCLGILAGMGLVLFDDRTGMSLIGAPWIVPVVLGALGVTVLVLALQVHQYATTDPAKRPTRIDPTKAMMTLVLSKALGIAGAALGGWYGGQLLMAIRHAEAAYYGDAVVQCAVAAGICLVDMAIGILGEWLCRLPPNDGPEGARARGRNPREIPQAATRDAS